ncbi:hypothetical protein [Comamonas sp. MYb396]|uniref:hypothetical protein n=1 Tax=Comamonas sp. MYb396 TaxID=2745302 RepID=UPI0030A507E3
MIFSPLKLVRIELIAQVLLLNTETDEVALAKWPICLNHKGKFDRKTIHCDDST